ncbi:hypothetical protein L1987_85032 [Smallanthus sonchifolius]|uniref:Uncharacterized protein n=1 Tax=Smallanthus sonchifolius TaxID=185202 RepID=A0ACB8XW89_9ASTR|nr:hypothetical protein L1987_85032 [Smallanthus sonchifolius]
MQSLPCCRTGLEHSPSIEALRRNGKNRSLQPMKLESRRMWKWASYCASEVGEDDLTNDEIHFIVTNYISLNKP